MILCRLAGEIGKFLTQLMDEEKHLKKEKPKYR